jgi:peptidyl-prolyl cis-trans isomerase C
MALANIGDVSDLVATDYGYHILQYTGDVTPGAVDYEKLKDEIKETLKTTLQDQKWNEIVEQWKTECDVKYYQENY